MREPIFLLVINALTWVIVACVVGVLVYEHTHNVNIHLCVEVKDE